MPAVRDGFGDVGQVIDAGDVGADAGRPLADRRHCGVDRLLVTTGEEYMGALGGQALRSREADPGIAAGDQRSLSVQLVARLRCGIGHGVAFSLGDGLAAAGSYHSSWRARDR